MQVLHPVATAAYPAVVPETAPKTTRSWILLGALGAVFALSTSDRSVLPVLKTTLAHDLHLTNTDYSWLVTTFLATYTLAYFAVGHAIRHGGVRNILTGAVLVMSCSAALSGTSAGVLQLGFALVLLGLAQACVVPSVTVTIFDHFGPDRHARAYAIVNAIQSSFGIAAPSVIAAISLTISWRWSFLLPGMAGVLVAAMWWHLTSTSTSGSQGGHASAPARGAPTAPSWRELFRSRSVLVLVLARAISDPFWFFFQYWQVAFLRERVHLSLADVGRWAWIPPLVGTAIACSFAVISDRLVDRGWPVVRARIVPILGATGLAACVFFLAVATTIPAAVGLCGLVVAMCATWLSLTTILMGALVPRPALPTALGLMSAVGGMSAVVLNSFAGALIDRFGYDAPLWSGAVLYPGAAALLSLHFLRRKQ